MFINNATAPALSLEDTQSGPGISLRIKGATADHFGRMHKIIHLQHALQLPFADVDLLVMSALRAEGQTQDFYISEKTLRALGVFCHLRSEYDVTAEQFAALIYGITPYAVGDTIPFLNRVLDGPGPGQLAVVEGALLLDGREFDISGGVNSNGQSALQSPIGDICRAFALKEWQASAYLAQVTQALGLKKPALSLPVFSSLYRLTRLPRLLRTPMTDGMSLISLLATDNPDVFQMLAGTPRIGGDQKQADILDVLIAAANLAKWLKQKNICAQALLRWVTPQPDLSSVKSGSLYSLDESITQTLRDAFPRLRNSLLSDARITQQIGTDIVPDSNSWLSTLATWVDAQGLVKTIEPSSTEALADKLAAELQGKLKNANPMHQAQIDLDEVAAKLKQLIDNALVAQEDILKHVISTAFGKAHDGSALTAAHALPLLRWINETGFNLLADMMAAAKDSAANPKAPLKGLSIELWSELSRHAQAVIQLHLSSTGLTALLDHPAWFNLEDEDVDRNNQNPPTAPSLDLDLCYQVSRYRYWIEKCQAIGFEEADALDFFVKYPASNEPGAVKAAAQRLGELIGWNANETMLAMPYVTVIKEATVLTDSPKTFDNFLSTLTSSELGYYNFCERSVGLTGLGVLLYKHVKNRSAYPNANAVFAKFEQFLANNPGPLKVTQEHYLSDTWKDINKNAEKSKIVTLEVYVPDKKINAIEYEARPCVPNTISDIDWVLRLRSLGETTGLSCQSLMELSRLDEQPPYENVHTAAQFLLGACNDEGLAIIEPALQENWRDALAAYLLGYCAPSNTALQPLLSSIDDLSSYFLTDILVSSAVKTHKVIQATASLQHYLHRLFARLEPGYSSTLIARDESNFWQRYLSEYGSWKIWRTQLNHPENLIYYANRPNKSSAFQSLEVELNQGKLDTELLQTAITSYLTKFEQTSNLQVVSGYLDGVDPKNDTYHFIGKTNASPAEYYWRSMDMGLRDDKERLSPLAWTEWEKIAVSMSGQTVQSCYTDPATQSQYKCDAIRPVIIEGRPYVFWVERGTVGLPSADEKNQTPTKFKKLSVQYIYKQSDGFWAPPNELICLDGTRDGTRLPDKDNPYLKDDTYQPGLIALVDIEGERARDPWLTVMLYNCAYAPATSKANQDKEESKTYGNLDTDYFVEARDLLLIDKKQFQNTDETKKFSKIAFNSYQDVRKIQHPYTGDGVDITFKKSSFGETGFALENYKTDILSTPELRDHGEIFYTTYIETKTASNASGFVQDIIKNHPLIKQLPFLSEREGDRVGVEPFVKVLNKAGIPVKSQTIGQLSQLQYSLIFSRNASESSITAMLTPEKSVTLTAHYPKIVIDPSITPTLNSTSINTTFMADGTSYTITHTQTNLSLSPRTPPTLSIEIASAGTSPLGIGYSVTCDNQLISEKAERAYRTTDSAPWTYTLQLQQPEHLLEDSFRVEFYIQGKLVASVPMDIIINPKACQPIELRLYAKGPKETSFRKLTEESVVANGQATLTQVYPWTDMGSYTFALCEAGDPLQNVFTTFDIRLLGLDEKWDISIKRNDQQAQYLDLSAVADQAPIFPSNAIRLNTLFGKKLVSRAARSVERALEWEAQFIEEPTIDPNAPTPSVDFHGANGAYFRELFLYLPDLVATRLSEQQQFDEAERWYTQYLFDPYRTQKDEKKRPPLWNTRPLAEAGSGNSEPRKAIDPTARAFMLSRYYRQAVFLSLLDNWQHQGDHFYRQLTPGSLNHAWLCYQKALKLIGPLPERTSVSRWIPVTLNAVSNWIFRAPINERVTSARKTLERRLFNLRHGLTLDGKILPVMDWSKEGTDAFGFGQRGVGQLVSSYNSDRAQIPGYRFRQLIPMARAAVQQLQDMGRHYMKLMEDEFNTTLSVLLKQQEIRISDFTLKLKQESINSFKAKKETLQLSRQVAVSRKDFYANLIQIGRSPMEEAATGLIWTSAVMKSMSIPFQIAAGITEGVVPTIYGLAFGGNKPYAPMAKTALALEISGEASKFVSEQLLVEAGYERRAIEWEFELKQAELDIQSVDQQLKEANIELNAATLSLDEAHAERANLEEAHVAMTTGFTIIPVYNWLVARQELLYGPAYDAVLSLCLGVEAAWRYEIGDYSSPAFIKTSAWADAYKGMLAGESLLVDLQEMENAYTQRNERRLSIRKTIDVKGIQTAAEWLSTIKALTATPISFELKSVDFDKNYPGHYLRQLKHVSVSFVMNSDAGASLGNVSAILTQTDSTTLVEPDLEGAAYLYAPVAKAPTCIKRNLRAQQQIALSSAVADDGLGLGKADWAYELLFHDGRYLPFEGTGAVSRWQLAFPDADFVKGLLAADGKTTLVNTIQIHLVYTALDGGKEFTDKVKTLLQTSQ
ncbi:neuraminidase-like domain-containing protein [Pseudomonas sp. 5S4]|nr:neuraminidase-like domain-containing protein [Pseudomonas sp. 5S4]MEB0247609.1 neuraminidase-like domain-containing protein [Pseudomonas sp. 10S5]